MARNLVQELREIANDQGDGTVTCERLRMWHCNQKCGEGEMACRFCIAEGIRFIANRIATEYSPKPEPDSLEKVTGEMLDYITSSFDSEDIKEADAFKKRLEALGVTFDE